MAGRMIKVSPPLSFVLIVHAKLLKQLIEEIEKLSVSSYDVIRATVPGLWAFINILPRRGISLDTLRECLSKNHVFFVPSSLTTVVAGWRSGPAEDC